VLRRPVLLIPLVAVLVVGVVGGGLFYWSSRDGGDSDRDTPAQATGVDAPATDGGTDPLLGEEYLRAVEQALRVQQMEEEQRVAAEAYAKERADGEAVASGAVGRWGSGQLLLAMPSIDVTASVSSIGFERDGRTPASPSTPWGVGWSTFSDFPATSGNAVFSGHVDWYTGAPAVFGRLRNVKIGDPVYMVLADGTPVAYKVERTEWVTPYTADVGEIFGVTDREALTFITCGGTWDPVAHDYSHRLIVRAYRTW
jgi:LPXTG-site transpeptidase (sortase) family protein